MRIVLDTNVLVSGLLNPDGAPGHILDWILAGQLHLFYDDRILAEYSDVLVCPKFGFSQDLARAIIGYVRLSGEAVTALSLSEGLLPDPDDRPFAEVARSGGAKALVTGNQEHFAGLEAHGSHVLSPSALVDFMRQE
jgi:putative PIN family toxin of toxin-antitoxin system